MNKCNLVLTTGENQIGHSGFPSTSLPPELHIRGYSSMQNHNNNYNNHHHNNHIYSTNNSETNITATAHNKLASLSTYIHKANCSSIYSTTLLSGSATNDNTEAPMQHRRTTR